MRLRPAFRFRLRPARVCHTLSLTEGSMAHSQSAKIARSALDPLWQSIREEVAGDVGREPVLASFLHATVLNHKSLEDALGFLLAGKLACSGLPAMLVRELIADAVEASPGIGQSMRADIRAIRDRDPAAKRFSEPFLSLSSGSPFEIVWSVLRV